MTNMIPPEIIKLAIEGGYRPPVEDRQNWYRDLSILTPRGWESLITKVFQRNGYSDILLDREFWIALSKSCGWKDYVGEFSSPFCSGGYETHSFDEAEWQLKALEFYYLILTDKGFAKMGEKSAIEKFWASLVDNKG